MFKSITFKLWFALSITLVLTLAGVSLIAHKTMQQRFISHSFDVLKEQLGPLEDKIIMRYEADRSLDAYKDNVRLWHRSIRISLYLARKIREFNAAEDGERLNDSPRGGPFRNPSLRRAQERFARTLSLYTPDKQLIVGGNLELSKAYLHPVTYYDELIAYIAFEKPKYVLKEKEDRYLQGQLHFLITLSTILIVIMLLVSAVVSRWFLAPINKIRESVSEVAKGNLDKHVDYESGDELGKLVENFNGMLTKLEEHEDSRRRWVADISHEMRTPVAVLKAQIKAMLDGIRPLDQKNLELLQTKIDGLGRLINDLHELTMADIGALSLSPQKMDLSKCISGFIEDNVDRAKELELTFEFVSTLTKPALVEIDLDRITQILTNLFENSLRYTTAPGHIAWSLTKQGQFYCLHAQDSAPNVPDTELEKIFERLYRVEKSRNTQTGGSGLGLSLSRNLAQAHGGSLSASQSTLGGLKFTLQIPELNHNEQ